jgi:hypothetical protein
VLTTVSLHYQELWRCRINPHYDDSGFSFRLPCRVSYVRTIQVSATDIFMLVLGRRALSHSTQGAGTPATKWQGMEDDAKEHELVQEWHEHVDM